MKEWKYTLLFSQYFKLFLNKKEQKDWLFNNPQPWPLFFESRIRIHRIRIRILLSSCKNSKKNLDSYYFVTLFGFLSLKNDENVPSKSNKQKKLCVLKN